jgi:RimJ/RimL family protein N-acetyltransferase
LRRFCRQQQRPLIVDIDGPEATASAAEFRAVALAEGTTVLLLRREQRLLGYVVQRDVDEDSGVATVDFAVVAGDTVAETMLAAALRTFKAARLQVFVLAAALSQLSLAGRLGFMREGVLRRHFWCHGDWQDLVVLGRMAGAVPPTGPLAAPRPPLDLVHGSRLAARGRGELRTLATRPVAATDRSTLRRWFTDPGLQAVLDDGALTAADVEAKIDELLPSDDATPRSRGFVLEVGGRAIGLLHFLWINWLSRTAEVDLLVDGAARASLITGQAVLSVGTTAFDVLGLHKVYAFIYADNQRALRVFSRFMAIEATLPSYRLHAGRREPAIVCGMLADECRAGLALMERGARRNNGS